MLSGQLEVECLMLLVHPWRYFHTCIRIIQELVARLLGLVS